MIGPSYHLFHLSNYHMFIKGITDFSFLNIYIFFKIRSNFKSMEAPSCHVGELFRQMLSSFRAILEAFKWSFWRGIYIFICFSPI